MSSDLPINVKVQLRQMETRSLVLEESFQYVKGLTSGNVDLAVCAK